MECQIFSVFGNAQKRRRDGREITTNRVLLFAVGSHGTARGQAKETRLFGTVHVFQENGACAILDEQYRIDPGGPEAG